MFKPNTKVVCVSNNNAGSELIENKVYTVDHTGLYKNSKGNYVPGVHLKETKPPEGYNGFAPERFVPLEEGFEDRVLVKAFEDSMYDELCPEILERL